jgi:hypothetical protein
MRAAPGIADVELPEHLHRTVGLGHEVVDGGCAPTRDFLPWSAVRKGVLIDVVARAHAPGNARGRRISSGNSEPGGTAHGLECQEPTSRPRTRGEEDDHHEFA